MPTKSQRRSGIFPKKTHLNFNKTMLLLLLCFLEMNEDRCLKIGRYLVFSTWAWAGQEWIFLHTNPFLTKYEDSFIYNDYPGPGMLRAMLTVFVLVITRVFPPVLVCCSTLRTLLFTVRWRVMQHCSSAHTSHRKLLQIHHNGVTFVGAGGRGCEWLMQQQFIFSPPRHTGTELCTTHRLAWGQEVVIVLHYLDKYFIVN